MKIVSDKEREEEEWRSVIRQETGERKIERTLCEKVIGLCAFF